MERESVSAKSEGRTVADENRGCGRTLEFARAPKVSVMRQCRRKGERLTGTRLLRRTSPQHADSAHKTEDRCKRLSSTYRRE